jgi:uncharacterized protein
VKVTPRASRTVLKGWVDGVLQIKVQAPPVEGAANEAVVRFLSDKLGIPKSRVEVVRGGTSREKIVRVEGLKVARVIELLGS